MHSIKRIIDDIIKPEPVANNDLYPLLPGTEDERNILSDANNKINNTIMAMYGSR